MFFIGINRTSMIIIGKKSESNVLIPISLYYDFDQPGWLEYPMFDLKDLKLSESISLAKVMEKTSAGIYACITLAKYDPDLLDYLAYISIQSYDLSFQLLSCEPFKMNTNNDININTNINIIYVQQQYHDQN